MPERTQRGEEDRKKEDEKMEGQPLKTPKLASAGTTTRDQSVEPAQDGQENDKRS